MIQRHRAHDIRTTGECNNADAIIRPSFDKFTCDFADRVHPGRFLSADRKIFRKHRPGDIEYEDDVDPTGFNLGKALAELRTCEPNHENGKRSQQQCSQNFPCARGTLFSDCPKPRCG